MQKKPFVTYAWILVGYNIFVILWGAFVRATGSGAGCGNHWPLCNGEVIPWSPRMETVIEFGHRLTSGLLGILMLILLVWAYRSFSKEVAGERAVRKAATWALFFVMTEALIGAGLVRFEWVADNDSVARVYTMAFHLVNTFFLLTAATLTAWFAAGGKPFRLTGQGLIGIMLILSLLGLLVVGASGAVIALGDTLHLTAGITPEESPVVATLIGLRVYHPLIAIAMGVLLWLTVKTAMAERPSQQTRRFGGWVVGIYAAQLFCGAINVWLKVPVFMQLLHLLLSDLIWIALILLTAFALSDQSKRILSPLGTPVESSGTA